VEWRDFSPAVAKGGVVRLFVALDVSDETRAQVRKVRETLEPQLARARRPPRVTWVADGAAHVTLRFIGEVADEIGDRVQEAMQAPLGRSVFEIDWRGVGTFPGGRHPRVIWIGVASGADAASSLAQAINARLDPIVGPGEARPFRPHLTVGRVKEPGAGFDWPLGIAAVEAGATRSRIDHVTLYRSRTSPKGPTYTALCTTPLASA
jgi:2'-5' RNA ligase